MRWAKAFAAFIAAFFLVQCGEPDMEAPEQDFELIEATIADIHNAYARGDLTARELTQAYLDRIAAYDKGTGLNAIVVVNDQALATADALDAEFAATGTLRPLHGIPLIVKDNYETIGLQSAAGSSAFAGYIADKDATQVRLLKEAGAIVLAKSNMDEFAFSPMRTVSSILGVTKNPYDLTKVPAGSSGGTAASVAANMGLAGLGTDTGNSIRGPSGHNALVGMRSTMGVTSREGIFPLYLRNDIGGPMARTVEDAARIFDVIAQIDPLDAATSYQDWQRPEGGYLASLDAGGLKGVRIGVFTTLVGEGKIHPDMKALFDAAVKDLEAAGAITVPVDVPDFFDHYKGIWCGYPFRVDMNAFLTARAGKVPWKSMEDMIANAELSDHHGDDVRELVGSTEAACISVYEEPKNVAMTKSIMDAMDAANVAALVYPTWNYPARDLDDNESPAGNNSGMTAPHTGQPAITVPMGFTPAGLPGGLQIMGRHFMDHDVFKYAYAYEQATQHRKPPEMFGPLKARD